MAKLLRLFHDLVLFVGLEQPLGQVQHDELVSEGIGYDRAPADGDVEGTCDHLTANVPVPAQRLLRGVYQEVDLGPRPKFACSIDIEHQLGVGLGHPKSRFGGPPPPPKFMTQSTAIETKPLLKIWDPNSNTIDLLEHDVGEHL
jgi:hypothetical protein